MLVSCFLVWFCRFYLVVSFLFCFRHVNMVRRKTTNLANVELFGTCACVDTVSVPSHSPHRLASSISLQVLGQPFETISVTSGLYNTAHEHLKSGITGQNVRAPVIHHKDARFTQQAYLERAFTLSHFFVVLAAGHVDAEDRLESFFWKRGGLVNLVSKDQERHVLHIPKSQRRVEADVTRAHRRKRRNRRQPAVPRTPTTVPVRP